MGGKKETLALPREMTGNQESSGLLTANPPR
jgi:hypothetical protein